MPDPGAAPPLIPLAVKVLYTAFLAVLVPIYWKDYGPVNFLYFCDVALFFTLAASGSKVRSWHPCRWWASSSRSSSGRSISLPAS